MKVEGETLYLTLKTLVILNMVMVQVSHPPGPEIARDQNDDS